MILVGLRRLLNDGVRHFTVTIYWLLQWIYWVSG